jgi:ATP-binding cassette subfamily F protein 3
VAAYKNQREQIEHLEAFITRFRAQATKAKQVQSRIKELEKIERIEIPEEEPVIHFSFPQPPPSGKVVVTAQNLAKSYGPKDVLHGINFTIDRGDRVALVGHNGAGKSTLIRLLMGMEAPTSGSVQLGHNVIPEYFAQDQYKVLDPTARMLDDISRAAIKVPELALRSLLGCFLFSGDDVFKTLGVLSGGERNRFALARILVSPSNFLLLDEPTNHLDMRAKDVLLEAIESFTGTVIFVSHDRYFLDRLATKVLEVKDGGVVIYPGNFAEYVRDKEEQEARAGGSQAKAIAQGNTKSTAVETRVEAAEKAESPASTENAGKVKRVNPIKLKQMEDRFAFLEEEVPRLEGAIAHTEGALGNYVSAAETERQTRLLEELRGQLVDSTAEWEELMMALDECPGEQTLARPWPDVA